MCYTAEILMKSYHLSAKRQANVEQDKEILEMKLKQSIQFILFQALLSTHASRTQFYVRGNANLSPLEVMRICPHYW